MLKTNNYINSRKWEWWRREEGVVVAEAARGCTGSGAKVDGFVLTTGHFG